MVRRESISSAQNPKIKHLLALQEKSRLRKEEGLFVVEGAREVARALDAGYQAATLFVCPEIFAAGDITTDSWVVEVPAALYEKIALRGSSEGILAEMRVKSHRLEDLSLPENALIIVLESIEKPGNLGAILRSADGAGADALIVCDPLADGMVKGKSTSDVDSTVYTNWFTEVYVPELTEEQLNGGSGTAVLTALSIASVTLNPTFDAAKTSYTATVTGESSAITATAASGVGVAITVNGNSIASGGNATWATGENIVKVTASKAGSASTTYTVIVTKS